MICMLKLVRKSPFVWLSYPLSIPFGLHVYLTFKLSRPDLMCATHVSAIGNTSDLGARSENEKLTATRNFTYHVVEKADKEYKLYIQCLKEATEEHQSPQHPEPIPQI